MVKKAFSCVKRLEALRILRGKDMAIKDMSVELRRATQDETEKVIHLLAVHPDFIRRGLADFRMLEKALI